MKDTEAARWFKTQFQKQMAAVLAGTPFTVDLLTAVALQETGYLWRRMLDEKKLSTDEILERCVGDTIDKGRSAFPKNKAALLAVDKGSEMFEIARKALITVAPYDKAYKQALDNPDKFIRGYGIYQYDLQAFIENEACRDYFLNRRWRDFPACLQKVLEELRSKLKQLYGADKKSLTDTEQVFVAIVYNMGMKHFKFSKGFKQGHESDGRYYGENIFEFLRVSQSVSADATEPLSVHPGLAPLPPPTPVEVCGNLYAVTVDTVLRLRREPKEVADNIIARLPNGQLVHYLNGKDGDAFWEVETNFNGAYLRGFASPLFLTLATGVDDIPMIEVAAPEPLSFSVEAAVPAGPQAVGSIPAVFMPRKDGTITNRTSRAGAHSLNEAGQPGRKGESAAKRCEELGAIIDWLAVDRESHMRYQPTVQSTYCNIYAHDYCTLAGVYLPRVWWLQGAVELLAKGKKVDPIYEKTIDEQRANDLFRWLRDFGPRFGWRQTGTLTKLQETANLGGICLIVARRKDDGRSGHIVAVVPETAGKKARRNTAGEVIAPLQSQAGSVNFQYSTSKLNWWTDERFAESAFYVHA